MIILLINKNIKGVIGFIFYFGILVLSVRMFLNRNFFEYLWDVLFFF